jgi:hypothetical protein
MDIGIGLPNAVRGVERRGIVEYAHARDGQFRLSISQSGTFSRRCQRKFE